MRKKTGWLLALLTYFIYSTNSPLAKAVFNEGMSPATLLSGRFLFASILFVFAFRFTNLGTLKDGERPLDQKGRSISVIAGILNGVALLSFFHSFEYLQASTASVLGIALYLIFTLIILSFLGEKLTPIKLIRLILGLVGVYLLINPTGGGQVNLFGIGLIFVGSFTFASQMILVQRYLKSYNLWQITAIQVVLPAVIIVLFWLFEGVREGALDFFVPGLLGWTTIIVLGVFSTFFGRWLTYRAMSIIGNAEMALIAPLETALVIVWSFLFLGERLTPTQWVGALLVGFGVILGQLLQKTAVLQPKLSPNSNSDSNSTGVIPSE